MAFVTVSSELTQAREIIESAVAKLKFTPKPWIKSLAPEDKNVTQSVAEYRSIGFLDKITLMVTHTNATGYGTTAQIKIEDSKLGNFVQFFGPGKEQLPATPNQLATSFDWVLKAGIKGANPSDELGISIYNNLRNLNQSEIGRRFENVKQSPKDIIEAVCFRYLTYSSAPSIKNLSSGSDIDSIKLFRAEWSFVGGKLGIETFEANAPGCDLGAKIIFGDAEAGYFYQNFGTNRGLLPCDPARVWVSLNSAMHLVQSAGTPDQLDSNTLRGLSGLAARSSGELVLPELSR